MEFLTRQESQDSSSLSDAATAAAAASSPGGGSFNSDEDTSNLAINRPKKRAGRKIFKETRHPIYRGVRRRNGNKWVCELREPNKKTRIWLGTYPTLEMAARAHDVAALALRGKSACLNFADSAWRLPVPGSADAVEIRRVAGEAAEMFRPEEFGVCYRDVVEESMSNEDMISEELNCTNLGQNGQYLDSIESGCYSNNIVFVDEEEVFEMPRLIEEMAEGLLMSPVYNVDGDSTIEWSDFEDDYNVSLWSY